MYQLLNRNVGGVADLRLRRWNPDEKNWGPGRRHYIRDVTKDEKGRWRFIDEMPLTMLFLFHKFGHCITLTSYIENPNDDFIGERNRFFIGLAVTYVTETIFAIVPINPWHSHWPKHVSPPYNPWDYLTVLRIRLSLAKFASLTVLCDPIRSVQSPPSWQTL